MKCFTLLQLLPAISAAVVSHRNADASAVWQPAVGAKWQIVLSSTVNPSSSLQPADAGIWDIDLFSTPASTIQSLQSKGIKVICYFSAGTSENWRPDFNQFASGDMGSSLPDWPGERWLNIRNANVLNIMKARIKMASTNGCDAIDPDNMDGYSNSNGLSLTAQDSIDYLHSLASEAAKYGMSIGLKNSQQILPNVMDSIQFAVNEECAKYSGDCAPYDALISAGKPVFHIEYATYTMQNGQPVLSGSSGGDRGDLSAMDSADVLQRYCLQSNPSEANTFSTVVKVLDLDGFVEYCDGSWAKTATAGS